MAARTETRQQKGSRAMQEDERSERTRSMQQRSEQGGESQPGRQQSQQTALTQRQQATPAFFSSPFSFMRRFGEGMEQLFSDFGMGGLTMRGFGDMAAWSPQIEVFQREGQLVIRADLPGLKKDDVQLELQENAVVLRGERQEERREEREGYYTTERTYGRFYREIPLPEGVEADEANAVFRDGVLEVTMPLSEKQMRGRRLEIQEQPAEQSSGKARTQAAGGGR
jgi:HSP20 family protein